MDETQFMIMRTDAAGSSGYAAIGTAPFNTTQYHDVPASGNTYDRDPVTSFTS